MSELGNGVSGIVEQIPFTFGNTLGATTAQDNNLKFQKTAPISESNQNYEDDYSDDEDDEEYEAPPPRESDIGYFQPEDRKQIDKLSQKLNDFKQTLPDPAAIRAIVDQTQKTHKKVMA